MYASRIQPLAEAEVEYEILPFVTDPREAIKSYAPAIHPEGNLIGGEPMVLSRGNIDEGFSEADLIIDGTSGILRQRGHNGSQPGLILVSVARSHGGPDDSDVTGLHLQGGCQAHLISVASALPAGRPWDPMKGMPLYP